MKLKKENEKIKSIKRWPKNEKVGMEVWYRGEPVEAVGGINEMQAIVGEESAIECARAGGYVKRRLIFPTSVELPVEIRQPLKYRVEVIGGKIVQIHTEFRRRFPDAAAGLLHCVHDLFYVGESVGPRRASQVRDA